MNSGPIQVLKWEIGACGVNIGKTLTSSWIKISRLSDFKLNYFGILSLIILLILLILNYLNVMMYQLLT